MTLSNRPTTGSSASLDSPLFLPPFSLADVLLALLPVVSDAAVNVVLVRKGEGATIERWKRDLKSLTLALVFVFGGPVPLGKEEEGSEISCL